MLRQIPLSPAMYENVSRMFAEINQKNTKFSLGIFYGKGNRIRIKGDSILKF
jgi:hypothetical protein